MAAVILLAVFTVITGVVYPLVVTGIAQLAFDDRADGSLVVRDGRVVGSSLVGQSFTEPGYFHPRPSSAGDGYDAMASGASSLGPTNPDLLADVARRRADYVAVNDLAPSESPPVEALTGSGSGLDPHISPADARLQARRVAAARGVSLERVLGLVDDATEGRVLGVFGDPGVNVLELNLALDGRL